MSQPIQRSLVVILVFAHLDEVVARTCSYLGRDGCLAHEGRCPCEHFLVCEAVSEILVSYRAKQNAQTTPRPPSDGCSGEATANEWLPEASIVSRIGATRKPGDDSYTSNSHAVSVPGAGNQNYTPSTKIIFHQGHARASGISEVNVVCTFLICFGAMHVLGVVGLSWFVGGGWRGSLELPRPLVIGVVSTVHVQCVGGGRGEAALRSARHSL